LIATLGCLVVAVTAAAHDVSFESATEYVVDTVPGAATAAPADPTITATQFRAAQFTLDSNETVVGIEGWLAYLSFFGELPVEVVVYGDAGDVPDATDVLWEQLFLVASGGTFLYPADWYGVDGITLELEAGTYWVSFELPSADFGTGAMPPTPLQELDNYATGSPSSWAGDDTLNLGLRVAVPEPGGVAQLSSGILALLALHGRRMSRARRR